MSQSRTHTKRPARGFRRGLYAAAALAGLCAFLTLAGAAGAQHRTTAAHTPRTLAALPQTVVSLTFDDGDATQYQTRTMLSSRGFHATYFLNSGNIGTDSSYMTWAQVQNLYSDGNEIGGHTITHPDLTTLSATEAAREVCYDRNIILSHGYPVTDFAYPFGTSTPAIESMVHNCGYNSARATDEFGQGCAPGPCSETIPPRDAYRTFVVGDGDDGLANIEKQITLAENNGGGWAQLLFHDICSGCSGHSFSVANLTTLLNWLQGQVQTNNVVIKTVNQVIGGSVQPSVPGPPLPPPPNGTNAMPNPSLETDADGDGVPDCYFTNTWGNETAAWARTNDAHTGGWAEKVTVSTYSSGSSSLLANFDLGDCAPTVTAGHQYRVTEWYKSTAPVSFDLYYRSTSWFWSYATSSGNFPASSTWAQASWLTPVIPAGTNGAIAGLEIAANGTLTVDDLGLDDANPSTDSTPPSTTVSCNAAACSSGWYAAPVTVTLSATDNTGGSGVKQIVYTTNGTDPSTTNGTVYGGAFTVPATATVKYRAYDNAGNAEAIKSQLVQVDTAAPATTISCNGAACSSSFYGAAVSVTLAAADTGGSGLSKTVYTTDGSTPSLSNGTTYSGAFSVSATATVKYRSFDVAGNAEAIKSQLVQIDTVAPSSTIACNSSACSNSWYGASVSVGLQATDNSGGSGVQEIVYTTDGTTPPLSNGTVYSGAFTVSATATVKYRAFDVAGNAETVRSQLIQIDTTAPQTAISCNGSTCTSGFYNASVSVALQAADGGSGVSKVVYTTDGSDPSLTNGTVYSSAFSLGSTTTVKYRSFDVAGNAEQVESQTIQVSAGAPTTTIACNATTCTSGWYTAPVSVTLAASDNGGPGVNETVYTTDGSTPTTTNGNVYSGAFTVSATTTVKYRSFDNLGNAEAVNSQTVQIDTTAPASTISCNGSACSSGWYAGSAVSVTLQSSDDLGGSGVSKTVYTTDGSDPTTTNGTVYNGAFSLSSSAIVKYRAFDVAGNAEQVESQQLQIDTAAPQTTIACNGGGCASWYNAAVSVTLQPVDTGGSGLGTTVYTTDGSTPTLSNGTSYGGAFTVSSTTTLKYRSFDVAGNAEQVESKMIGIDIAAPQTTIVCNGTSCSAGWYTSAVTVTLPASDSGGSGISKTVYTTDGSDPSLANGTVYSGAFTVNAPTTVKYRSFDVAGNTEQVEAQTVQVDTNAPASTISCNGAACANWYNAAVSVTIAASDNAGGSGVSQIVYTTDGSTPTLVNGTAYAGAFTVSSTTTVKYRAFDTAGNAEQVESQTIGLDTAPPASTISCNGTSCASSFYSAAVSVTLAATDSGGSGFSKIVYTTDGSTPTLSNGSTYSSAFSVSSPTTVNYRAFDVAGNAEGVNSQLVQVDTTAPVTTVSCNGAACSAGWYNAGATVTLTGVDNTGGSGVSKTVYTTDGSPPTQTNGNTYLAPFLVPATATVKFLSVDNVGNTEGVKSQLVQIDATAPTVSLIAPAANAQLTGQAAFSANASDNVSVARVDFLVDGAVVGSAASSPYTFTWNSASVSDGTHTVQARAVDSAGNIATTTAITVTTSNTAVNLLQNPGLEQGSGTTPTCWLLGGYGTNTSTWAWTTDAHSGSHAENLTISSWTNGDRKLLQNFNATCATPTSAGHQYVVSVWYKSTAKSVIFAFASTTTATGVYNWWAQSPALPVASTWTLATWTTPVVPAGDTFISTGMGMQNVGSVTMDDFSLVQSK
jgi:peptidoglycan/xylan/chitin deacetylase (PgdA/CDA1 family)